MLWGKPICFYCRKQISKHESIEKKVQIYGKVGAFKRRFCNDDHIEKFEYITSELNRRKRPCVPCQLR